MRSAATGHTNHGTATALACSCAHLRKYDHIIFVDASSTESLQNSILNRVRLLDLSLNPPTPNEAIQLLADPRGNISRNWLIIMDNADNTGIPFRDFFPPCDFGAILITTRNITLGNLSPNGTIALDVMSRVEAIELLLFTALGASFRPTQCDRDFATEIVETLGYLPVAIVQAGCYIKLQKCLPDYANRLQVHRARLLRKPALAQLDKLKYGHSVYAAFDTTLSILTPLALKILGILSFVHFIDFPCPLFGIAASYGFDYQPTYLFDRTEEYQESVNLLKEAFCPNGTWEDEIVEQVLEELQQYSMVTLVPINSMVTLRVHPLIHSWAKDRLSPQEAIILREAGVRLLVCGTDLDHVYLWEYLVPHLKYISPASHDVHLNDRAALTHIIRELGDATELVRICEDIYEQVRASLGECHLQTSRAALLLADAYGKIGNTDKMEQLERQVVNLRSSLLGEQHTETFLAIANLARTLKILNRYAEAIQLEVSVLAHSRLSVESNPRGVAQALGELAATCVAQKQYTVAIVLFKEAIEILAALLGQAHTATMTMMGDLASCYALQGDVTNVRDLKAQMDKLKKQLDGPRYTIVLHHMDAVAGTYFKQEKFAEAESEWKEVLAGYRKTSGDLHERTLRTMLCLSDVIHRQGRYAESDALAEKVVEGRRLVYGDAHAETLEALHVQPGFLQAQRRYAEAEKLWREEMVGHRKMDGPNSNGTLRALENLSDALFEQNKHQEAETLRRELYEQYRETAGEHHRTTLRELLQLARIVFIQERYTEAAELFQKVVVGRRNINGNGHADTLAGLHWFGRSLYAQKKISEATAVWQEELAERRKVHDDRHLATTNVLRWLSSALSEQKEYAEAEILRREEWDSRRVMQGELAADTLSALAELALVIMNQGRRAEGLVFLRTLVEKQRAARGDDHPETQYAIRWLHEATTSARHEEVLIEEDGHGALLNTSTSSLPLICMPQPQRSFAWFQRFRRTGSISVSATSPVSLVNETSDVDA